MLNGSTGVGKWKKERKKSRAEEEKNEWRPNVKKKQKRKPIK